MWMVQYFHLHCTIDDFVIFSSNNLFIRGKIKLYTTDGLPHVSAQIEEIWLRKSERVKFVFVRMTGFHY